MDALTRVSDANRQSWDPSGYNRNAGFVADYGADLLDEWFEPKPGMDVLDLGCGEGVLTATIADKGANVIGLDFSHEQVEAARARGLDARVGDGMALDFDAAFDAVFTNAAIHWMPDQAAVVAGVHRALRPGGLFVGEFGGFGNVAAITSAMCGVCEGMGGDPAPARANTFPTVEHWSRLLERGGFAIERIVTFYRPTPLPTDIRGWLETFRGPFFQQFGTREGEAYDAVIRALEPTLRDEKGRWFADYVRLRFRAVRDG